MASYVSLCHHLSAPREVALENTDRRALVEMWRIRLEDARTRHKQLTPLLMMRGGFSRRSPPRTAALPFNMR